MFKNTAGEGVRIDMSRRSFLTGVAGVGAIAALGGLAGCAPSQEKADTSNAKADAASGPKTYDKVDKTYDTDLLIVGGGGSGLACAVRGHQVTLLEKEQELGGNFRIASYPTGKGQLSEAIRSLIVKCQMAGVDLRCGVEADEALLRSLTPDAVILATGSTPLVLPIPGLDTCGYVTAQAMLEARPPWAWQGPGGGRRHGGLRGRRVPGGAGP